MDRSRMRKRKYVGCRQLQRQRAYLTDDIRYMTESVKDAEDDGSQFRKSKTTGSNNTEENHTEENNKRKEPEVARY